MKHSVGLSALGAAIAFAALPAFAHEGDHTHMTAASALRHAITEPDHLLLIGMIAAIVALPVARMALRRVRK